jgi:hypothetical protein
MVDLLGAPPEARRSGGLLRIELKKGTGYAKDHKRVEKRKSFDKR